MVQRREFEFHKVQELQIIPAKRNSGGGLFSVSERLFHLTTLFVPKRNSWHQILTGRLQQKLNKYSSIIQYIFLPSISVSLDFYDQSTQVMPPIPSKIHCLFSFKNNASAINGMSII